VHTLSALLVELPHPGNITPSFKCVFAKTTF